MPRSILGLHDGVTISWRWTVYHQVLDYVDNLYTVVGFCLDSNNCIDHDLNSNGDFTLLSSEKNREQVRVARVASNSVFIKRERERLKRGKGEKKGRKKKKAMLFLCAKRERKKKRKKEKKRKEKKKEIIRVRRQGMRAGPGRAPFRRRFFSVTFFHFFIFSFFIFFIFFII